MAVESASGDALVVEGLRKSFPHPMTRRSVPVLRGIDFRVARGEIFGFLGPNGAGKTTTIKAVMGLIFPTAGRITVLGGSLRDPRVKARIGFLPENPYFYDYLSGPEFLDFYGRLFGLAPAERRRRVERLLARVGLEGHRGLPLRKYSKGMLQRIGLAQALLGDPEFILLDEPMSGLDPLGRREVREIILELRGAGKTVFFTSHILSDVEMLCDRVALLVEGRIRDLGRTNRLLGEEAGGREVTLAGLAPEAIPAPGRVASVAEGKVLVSLDGQAPLEPFLEEAFRRGGRLISVMPRGQSLEERLLAELERARREPRAGAGEGER